MQHKGPFFQHRRLALASLALVASASLLSPAASQAQATYPNKPIKLIVGFAAGGPTDIQARILAEKMAPILGQPIVVENKPGASTTIAAGEVARSAPDGYTYFLGGSGAYSITPVTLPQLPYDPNKSFEPVGTIGEEFIAMAINPNLPANNLKELAALIKSNPGKYSFASSGHGNITHLTGELFKVSADNIDLTHVPYKGAAPAVNDVVAGHVHMVVSGLGSLYPMQQAGKLKILAVAAKERAPFAPEIPTTAESGYPDVLSGNASLILAPAGTPPAIIEQFSQAMAKVAQDPDFVAKLKENMVQATPNSTPAATGEMLKREMKQWADLVKNSGINVQQQ